jgi:hypothetical protein
VTKSLVAGVEVSKSLRVLVACEFSGVVRDEFRRLGHDAWSCDLLPTDSRPDKHYLCDVRDVIGLGWDLMVAHPPCTHLAVSGARWFRGKEREQAEALGFVRYLMAAPVERIAIENPVSVISSRIRKPDQIIQPWMFGHREAKATCIWLKNLKKLVATDVVGPPPREGEPGYGEWAKVHYASPGPDRWKERSRFLPGIAAAMAEQWGGVVPIGCAA